MLTQFSRRKPISIDVGEGPPLYPGKEALAWVRRGIYAGRRVQCSCCGKRFSLFLFSPYMTAQCPYCLSFERYRLLCRYLRDETDFGTREVKVLDIAPTWSFQKFCCSFDTVDYLSIDIASPMAMRHMDLRNLVLEDDSFDWLFCYHVIEHIDEDTVALGELYRVLKPGGRAVIQVPILVEETVMRCELTRAEQDEILRFDDHRRGYGLDFKGLLEEAGFEVEVIDFTRSFDRSELKRYGLDASEDLYVCTK